MTPTAPAFALWFRPRGRRQPWRRVGEGATSAEASGCMDALIATGHPSGDWLTAPGDVDPNVKRASA